MFRYVVRRCVHQQSKIILSRDEKCFLAYHPEEEHPYEMTRPVPIREQGIESPLKVDSRNMFTQSPNLEQLQQLTYTPKGYWKEFRGKAKRKAYKDYFDDKEFRKGLTT